MSVNIHRDQRIGRRLGAGPAGGEEKPQSPYLPEDEAFPESFRKIWRVLLAPWNRR